MCKGKQHDVFASGWFCAACLKNYVYSVGIIVVDNINVTHLFKRCFTTLGQYQPVLEYFETWILIGWNWNVLAQYTLTSHLMICENEPILLSGCTWYAIVH